MADMIEIKHLNKYFGDLHVLKDINLTVKRGEKLVMIGPSGSGKSTLIRCVDYLEEPTSGEVVIDGTPLTKKNHLEMARKYSSMVFQQFNLIPHMTVLKNLTLAPMLLKMVSLQTAEQRAMALLERVGLCRVACRKLGLPQREPDLAEWTALVQRINGVHKTVQIALVGK